MMIFYRALVILLLVMCGHLPVVAADNISIDMTNDRDPFEKFNRGVFYFNQTTDHLLLKPLAVSYNKIVPNYARERVHNFFINLTEPVVFFNGLLQMNPKIITTALARFIINSFLGVIGINDVAKTVGLTHIKSGFSDSLEQYGFHLGPYLVLPIVGSSSIRGAIGTGVDVFSNPFNYMGQAETQYIKATAEIIEKRAEYLYITNYINQTSLDEYATYRSLYFQEHTR